MQAIDIAYAASLNKLAEDIALMQNVESALDRALVLMAEVEQVKGEEQKLRNRLLEKSLAVHGEGSLTGKDS